MVVPKDRWIDKLMMIDEVINKVHVRVNHNYNIMQGINLRLTMYKENMIWQKIVCDLIQIAWFPHTIVNMTLRY